MSGPGRPHHGSLASRSLRPRTAAAAHWGASRPAPPAFQKVTKRTTWEYRCTAAALHRSCRKDKLYAARRGRPSGPLSASGPERRRPGRRSERRLTGRHHADLVRVNATRNLHRAHGRAKFCRTIRASSPTLQQALTLWPYFALAAMIRRCYGHPTLSDNPLLGTEVA